MKGYNFILLVLLPILLTAQNYMDMPEGISYS